MIAVDSGFLWLAASSGAFSLLTPCVFPMVPITVSYFTQHGAADRRGAVRNALIFSAGIVAAFTALGLALSLLVGATGVSAFAANPWVNLFLAAIFIGFALSLLGWVNLRLPSRLLNAADALTRRHASDGALGALLMGVTFTLTSFTCIAPFMGTLLVLAAQGSWREPLVGMLVYSTVFAAPFLALALAPHWLVRLPRSGAWLSRLKVVLGLLEIAAAVKFLSNADLVWGWQLITRSVVLAIWAGIAGLIVVVLLRPTVPNPESAQQQRGLAGLSAAGLFLALGLWLLAGLGGRGMGELEALLPPRAAPSGPAVAAAWLPWQLNDLPNTLAGAKRAGRRVFVDFTGYTCTNCRWMEANIFTRPEIIEALGHYELARLYTDGEGEVYLQQQEFQEHQFGTVALPLYVILESDGRTVAAFPGLTRNPKEFLAFLAKAAAPGGS